jgi:hypothetical protein
MTTDVIERARKATAPFGAVHTVTPDLPPELAAIWTRLMRRSQKDGRFQFPTTFDVGYGTPEQRQRFAIWLLLSCAIEFADKSGLAMTRREFESTRAELQTAADTLRKMAAMAVRSGLREPHVLGTDEHIDPMIVAAEEAEDMVDQFKRAAHVVERDRGELREQAVAIRIAGLSRMLFGHIMPGVVVTLVEVLLGTKLERSRIRDWWKAFAAEE